MVQSTSVKTEESRWSEIARQGVAHLRREGNNPQPIQSGNGGGCFIATAVYGDIDHPDVRILRDFRDEVLSASIRGRWFISAYYLVPPKLVRFLNGAIVKKSVRLLIMQPLLRMALNQLANARRR